MTSKCACEFRVLFVFELGQGVFDGRGCQNGFGSDQDTAPKPREASMGRARQANATWNWQCRETPGTSRPCGFGVLHSESAGGERRLLRCRVGTGRSWLNAQCRIERSNVPARRRAAPSEDL